MRRAFPRCGIFYELYYYGLATYESYRGCGSDSVLYVEHLLNSLSLAAARSAPGTHPQLLEIALHAAASRRSIADLTASQNVPLRRQA
jgi:hypothetical protein